MKLNNLVKPLFILVVIGSFLSACKSDIINDLAESPTSYQLVSQSFSYISLSDAEKSTTSGAILRGKIVAISPTTWNQDNGEAWDNEGSGIATMQLHTVDIQVEQKIIDTLGLGDTITVTSLGTSPAEEFADYQLGVGDEAVLFVKKAKIAWREGETKEVILYTGSPLQSIYVKNYEGQYALLDDTEVLSLDELVAKISPFRSDVLK